MALRVGFSNAVIDDLLDRSARNWTRDVPAGFIEATFPFRVNEEGEVSEKGILLVTPAKESDRGRGAPFIDAFGELGGIEVGISLKVSSAATEERPPRNSSIAGGKVEHLLGMILASRSGALLPVLSFWQDEAGQWWRAAFDAGRILRENPVVLTDGWTGLDNAHADEQRRALVAALGYEPRIAEKNERGTVVAVSPLPRKSGGKTRVYLNVKVNHVPAGVAWVPVDHPAMPESYGELLGMIGEEGDMIG